MSVTVLGGRATTAAGASILTRIDTANDPLAGSGKCDATSLVCRARLRAQRAVGTLVRVRSAVRQETDKIRKEERELDNAVRTQAHREEARQDEVRREETRRTDTNTDTTAPLPPE